MFDDQFTESLANGDTLESLMDSSEDIEDYDTNSFSSIDGSPIEVPVANFSADSHTSSKKVESNILKMLKTGNVDSLLYLCGEIPRAKRIKIASSVPEDFKLSYVSAVKRNPALKWYAKLSKINPNFLKFSGKSLKLNLSRAEFGKIVKPFMADFDAKHSSDSPIVGLILSADKKIKKAKLESSLQGRSENNYSYQTQESESAEVREIDFSNLSISDEFNVMGGEEDEAIRIDDDTFDDTDNNIAMEISMLDLGHKAVADYLVEAGITDREAIISKLKSERFSSNKIHEILGIVSYVTSTKRLEAMRPKKKESSDEVSFDFEV